MARIMNNVVSNLDVVQGKIKLIMNTYQDKSEICPDQCIYVDIPGFYS